MTACERGPECRTATLVQHPKILRIGGEPMISPVNGKEHDREQRQTLIGQSVEATAQAVEMGLAPQNAERDELRQTIGENGRRNRQKATQFVEPVHAQEQCAAKRVAPTVPKDLQGLHAQEFCASAATGSGGTAIIGRARGWYSRRKRPGFIELGVVRGDRDAALTARE